jgi:hypothetical protein
MRIVSLLILLFFAASCGPSDEEKIIGKWYNDHHWFHFHSATEYSGGVGPITNQTKQPYVLEPADKKLTFYTDKESESYYVRYEFIGDDTLSISNFMNQTSQAVKYYKSNEL